MARDANPPSRGDPALTLTGVGKRYGGFVAVDDLSFQAAPGSILGLLGPNGAGKTTTIRMSLGLIAPSAGEVSILGAADAAEVRDRIGFLPEERGLYRRMTPVSAIAFFAALRGLPSAEGRARAKILLEEQGLGYAMHRQIRSLSRGMAQKVQILCAVAHEPDLVVLDEPFSGLDPLNQQALEGLIRRLADNGATVIFSTHVMQHAERLCDHIVLLAHGRKVFDGSVEAARALAPRVVVVEGGFAPEAMAGLPGVGEVAVESLTGGRSRLTGALAPGAGAEAAMGFAFAQGCEISRFEVREPALHDAFILLAGEAP